MVGSFAKSKATPAHVVVCFRYGDFLGTAFTESHGAVEAGYAGTNNENLIIGIRGHLMY